jgi:hypothetical protein
LGPRRRRCSTFASRQGVAREVALSASGSSESGAARQRCAFGRPAQGLPLHDRVQTQHVVNRCSVRAGLFFSTHHGRLRAARVEHSCEAPTGGSPPTTDPMVLVVIIGRETGACLHEDLESAEDHGAPAAPIVTKGHGQKVAICTRWGGACCRRSLRAALRGALHASFVKRNHPASPDMHGASPALVAQPRMPKIRGCPEPRGSAWRSLGGHCHPASPARGSDRPNEVPTTCRKIPSGGLHSTRRESSPARAPPGHAAAPFRTVAGSASLRQSGALQVVHGPARRVRPRRAGG